MSANATNSVFGQAIASRPMCIPRSPAPMIPRRILSFAPKTFDTASEPARPEATLPIKLRRDCKNLHLGGCVSYLYSSIPAGGAGALAYRGFTAQVELPGPALRPSLLNTYALSVF